MADTKKPIVVNPAAVIKSFEEQYNYSLALGVMDPDVYAGLRQSLNDQIVSWQAAGVEGVAPEALEQFVVYGHNLRSRMYDSVVNAGVATYANSPYYMNPGDRDKMTAEIEQKLAAGGSLEEIVRVMGESGQYDLGELQRVAYQVGNPAFDPSAIGDMAPGETGETALPFAPGEGGDKEFKPFEPVASDRTSPEDEFQKGFALFTRSLELSQKGQAPNIAALGERYQDLFNKYIGQIEGLKTAGGEPGDVFKDKFVNIGKSTDAQFDQETDRMQLQTVRPKLSAFDFLINNVDPEDVYASTEPARRPGRSQGGFRGFVRRINR